MDKSAKAGEFAIRARKLTKIFNGLIAVNGIDLEVKKGEIFAFLGPNGAGKSTTIKILTTLLQPTSGEILVNGYNPIIQQDEVRKSFGIVFQDPSLDDDLTAYENIEFHGILYGIPKALREKRIEELLRIVELWDRKDGFVKTFSGGMRRRLEIARGLLHHPSILFLDEPTLGLDPQTRNQMWNYILNLNKKENITIFFTTHYIEEAEKIAKRIAIIDHGRIIAEGTVEDLTRRTNTASLEDAFLSLTGREIRNEDVGNLDNTRMRRKIMRR
ncbi:MAG: ATP-binding cassette domain-containing protein [Candidatus Omnitrophota bacterium]